MKFMLLALVLNAGVFAAPADPPQAQQTASQRQALGDLAQRAQGEIDKIHGQMRDQVKAVQHKYRQLRYQVIGENQPGATALLQQMDDVRDKKKDALQALSTQELAELQALPKPVKSKGRKAINDKYNAQRAALREEYNKKMQALRPTQPTASPQQMSSQRQALDDLSRKEQGEIEKISSQQHEQMEAVRRKHWKQRYLIMEKHNPTEAMMTQMENFINNDQDLMQAELAESRALPQPKQPNDKKAVHDKYKTQRAARYEEHLKVMRALMPPHPTAPAAQPAAPKPKH